MTLPLSFTPMTEKVVPRSIPTANEQNDNKDLNL